MRGVGRGEVGVVATAVAIPYRVPLCLANGTVAEHCSVVVEIGDGEQRGYGEIAPGPGTTRAEASAIAARISLLGDEIARAVAALDPSRPLSDEIPHDLRAGIEAAALDRVARVRGENLSSTLTGRSCGAVSLRVNAMIDRSDADVARAAVDRAVADGYRCLKLKVGDDGIDGV